MQNNDDSVVHTETVKYIRALVWTPAEKLQQDKRNYKEWKLKIREWMDFNGLWCVIEPVEPEQVELGQGQDKDVKQSKARTVHSRRMQHEQAGRLSGLS